ncbi:MAG: threonylcarbamoyl-AMP synthase [Clostridia bacterium]|nr:threonylcarbamoyl-AMP synthase [Clostridia bacterium]
MTTQFVKINDVAAKESKAILEEAAKIIKNGGLVVFPTETVYGLGANGLDENASKKIYEAKGRPSDNPLIIHISTPDDAEKYCYTSDIYYALAKAFMPGPLTVIMPKKDIVPFTVTAGLDTVAVRCPANEIANALIEEANIPIAAPSANLSGKPSPTRADYVLEDMEGRVDMIIDGGECEIGLESTIVMIYGDSLTLLRPGAVTYDALCMVCEDVKIAPSVLEMLKENEKPLSPGMKYKHYAPESPLVLLDGDEENVIEYLRNEMKEKKCAILCYNEEIDVLSDAVLLPIGEKEDLAAHAHSLFTLLRDADKKECDVIYAHLPQKNGLGLALYNRMIRAAAHTIKKV